MFWIPASTERVYGQTTTHEDNFAVTNASKQKYGKDLTRMDDTGDAFVEDDVPVNTRDVEGIVVVDDAGTYSRMQFFGWWQGWKDVAGQHARSFRHADCWAQVNDARYHWPTIQEMQHVDLYQVIQDILMGHHFSPSNVYMPPTAAIPTDAGS
jgi:hypothetical protein